VSTKKPAFNVGDLIEHPRRPEWGPGRIVAQEENRLYVVFRDDLGTKAKVLLADLAAVRMCEVQQDAVLDELPPAKFDGRDWVLPRAKPARQSKKASAAAAQGS